MSDEPLAGSAALIGANLQRNLTLRSERSERLEGSATEQVLHQHCFSDVVCGHQGAEVTPR